MNQSNTNAYFNLFVVEEFDAPTREDKSRKAKSWTKVGVAFPHKDGKPGFNIQLKAIPMNGKLVALPPDGQADDESAESPVRAARR